jgi:hypothetical protein
MDKLKNGSSIKRRMYRESWVGFGENPLGFVSQTKNGSCRWSGTGWNRLEPIQGGEAQVPEGGAWQSDRSTRTGE